MKKLFLLLLIVFKISSSNAQIDSIFHVKNPQKVFNLKSLNFIGNKYFYGNKKLKSVAALEIPFYELNDSLVNQNYKTYNTLRQIGNYVSLIPLIYILGISSKPTSYSSNQSTFWIIYFSAIGTSIGLNIAANAKLRKAAVRYNEVLQKNRVGYWVIESDENSLGLAVKYKF